MIMKNKTQHKIRAIRSLHDLELEKARLNFEALKREEQIKGNFRNIVDFLSFRNLFQHLSNDISLTKSVVSTAFSVGKKIMEKFKKKKKKNKDNPSPITETPVEEKLQN